MGLLGKLVKNAVGEGLSKAVSSAVEKGVKGALQPKVNEWSEKVVNAAGKNIDAQVEALDNATEAINEANAAIEENPEAANALRESLEKWAQSAEKYANAMGAEVESASQKTAAVYQSEGDADYFASIVEKIPGAVCEKHVPLSKITAEVPAKAAEIDVLVSVGGAPKAALLLVPKNRYRMTAVVNTMNACEKNGITPLRFFNEFSNKPEYVTERVTAAL